MSTVTTEITPDSLLSEAVAASQPLISLGSSVTIDETAGLQNMASSTAEGDKNDNDIDALALPASVRSLLLGYGTPINAAQIGRASCRERVYK